VVVHADDWAAAPGVSRTQALAQLQPLFQTAAYVGLGGKPMDGEKPPTLSLDDAKAFLVLIRGTASRCAC